MSAPHSSKLPPKRILVMRYRFIGDTILTIPLLRNLRRAYPEATIDLLAGPNSGEILQHCPYIDNLLTYDTTRKHAYENPAEGDASTQSFWAYGKQLRHKRYELALVLKRSLSSALLAWVSWIPQRVGFDTEGRRYLLTQAFPYDKTRPEWDCFLDALRALEIPVEDQPYLEAWYSPDDMLDAKERLKAVSHLAGVQRPIHVAIHATTSNESKALPLNFFMAYAQQMLNSNPHIMLHALGAEQDTPFYERLRQTLPTHQQKRLAIHCGKTTLLQSQALLSQCVCMAGVDSGTLHMAAAAGIPVVGYYLPELVGKWAPMPLKNSSEKNAPEHAVFTTADVKGFVQATENYIALTATGELA